ncbi:MAG: hypothetical protein WCS85_05495 [Candidatus Peribacteraceae bacterium]|jgi:hypothetical protein
MELSLVSLEQYSEQYLSVEELLTYLAGPFTDETNIHLVKFGIIHEPGSGSTAYLFPQEIDHDKALATIIVEERQRYDALVDFDGAGVLTRDASNINILGIGWGSTTSTKRFGREKPESTRQANAYMLEIRSAVQEKMKALNLPLAVRIQWQKPSPPGPTLDIP